jgi:hypothetical protein
MTKGRVFMIERACTQGALDTKVFKEENWGYGICFYLWAGTLRLGILNMYGEFFFHSVVDQISELFG